MCGRKLRGLNNEWSFKNKQRKYKKTIKIKEE
jgi:hypothetical protein